MQIKWWHIVIFVGTLLFVAVLLHPSQLQLGWMFKESNKIEAAIEKFKKVYIKQPENYRAAKQLAESLEVTGKTREAESMFENLIKIKPNDKNFHNIVRFYAWTQQPAKAMKMLEEWYNYRRKGNLAFTDEDGKTILKDLYGYYLLYQDYDKAAKLLQFKKSAFPEESVNINYELINAYEKAGDLGATVGLLEEMLSVYSLDEIALNKFMQIAGISKKTDAARKILIKNLNEHQDDEKSWLRIIKFETDNRNFQTAEDWYKKWLEKEKTNEVLKRNYIKWCMTNNRQIAAIRYLEDLISSGANDQYYTDTLIKLYEWNNEKEKLLPYYLSRFEKDPRNLENSKKLVDLLSDMRKIDVLENVLGKLLELDATNKKYILELVGIYDTQNRAKDAIALLERSVKLLSDAELFESLALHYQSEEDYEKALHFYEKTSVLNPTNYYPHYMSGEIYTTLGKPKEADTEFKTALELISSEKGTITTETTGARLKGLLGEKEESRAIFTSLIHDYPDDLDVANAYIETLLDTNNAKDALKIAQQYDNRFPDDIRLKRNLSRAYIARQYYAKANETLTSLMEKYPNDKGIKLDYAGLAYAKNDWHGAKSIYTEALAGNPLNQDIKNILDEIADVYRPSLRGGLEFTRMGKQNRYGPYFKYNHPINSRLSFDVDYTLNRATANVPGYKQNFVAYTNDIGGTLKYKPHYTLTTGIGFYNQLIGSTYLPSPIVFLDWTNRYAGRFNLLFDYNGLLEDPVTSFYFDGVVDKLHLHYEKILFERLIIHGLYWSNWYRINASKTGRGTGNDFGREDVAGGGGDIIIIRRPEIKLGYQYTYSKLHIKNNYLDIIPLIVRSDRQDILASFYHQWNKYWSTDLSAFVGNDSKRNLKLSQLDLYGFYFTNVVKATRDLDILAHYEYSSEDIFGNTGRYQSAFLEFLYKF